MQIQGLKQFVRRFPQRSNVTNVEEEVAMFGSGRVKKQQTPAYATRGDFCRIFEKDMNRLYLVVLAH